MTIKSTKTIGAIYFAALILIFIVIEYNRTGDFFVYLQAASDLFGSENIFKKLYGNPPSLFYFGNPFLTTLLYPFSLLPIRIAALVWKLINLIALFRIFQLIDNRIFKPFLKKNQNVSAIVVLYVGSFFWVYSNFHLQQLTIIILFLCLEALNQIFYQNRKWFGGILLGLALCIKITPIVFLPYLLYKLQWRSFISSIAIIVFAVLLPSLFLGWNSNLEIWDNWLGALAVDDPNWAIFDMNNRKNHGIAAWLSTLFIADIQDNVVSLTHRRYLIDLEQGTVKYLIYLIRVALVIFTLYFLKNRKRSIEPLKLFWEWSYLFLVIPLFFPQQRLYNFIFLLPAFSYLILVQVQQYQTTKINWKTILFSISILVFNLELLLGFFRKHLWYHKSATYATIILLILLSCQVPRRSYSDLK